MARDVTVRLSADIAAYIQAMGQAEQATSRVADAADRLSDIRITADSSVASDLDQAASSADAAASSMQGAAGSAESMSGGMNDAAASAQTAAGGMQEAGAASDDVAASVGNVSAASQDTAAAMMAVGGAAQDGAAGLQSAGAAGQDAGAGIESAASSAQVLASNLDGSGGSAQSFAASLSTVGAQSQDAAGSMQSLAGAAQDSAGGLDTAAGSAGTASGAMGDLLSTASGMQSEFRSLGGSMAIVGGGLAAMATSLITTGIEYNNLQQVAGQALSVMTDSATDAADQMDRLNEFASTSPFFRDTWIEAQRQLMAFGMEAERVVPTLAGIEEAVAAIGGGDQEIRQLVDILGQVEGQGRITGRELQRMGQMGIDAASIIGSQMGMTGNEIREQITAGAIDAQTAIDALSAGMSERFEGSADAIRSTFEGAKNDMIAFTRDIGSIIAAPLVNPEGGGFLVDIANMAADALLALRGLPDPLIQIAGLGTAGAAGVAILGGAFALAAPQITTFVTGAKDALVAVRDLGSGFIAAQGGLRQFATTAGLVAAAVAGLAIVQALRTDFQEAAASTSELESELRRAAEAGESTQAAFQHLADVNWFESFMVGREAVSDVTEAFELLYGATNDFGLANRRMVDDWALIGSAAAFVNSDVRDAKAAIEELDGVMAGMVSAGHADEVIDQMSRYAEQLRAAGYSNQEIADDFPAVIDAFQDYAAGLDAPISRTQAISWALDGVKPAAVEAAEAADLASEGLSQLETDGIRAAAGMDDLAGSALQVADAVSEAASGLDDMLEGLTALGGIQRDATQALGEYHEQVREVEGLMTEIAEGTDGYAASLDVTTEAGQRNYDALADLGDAHLEMVRTSLLAGDSVEEVSGKLGSGYEQMLEYVEAMGYSGDEAHRLASELMQIDPELDFRVEADQLEFATLLAEGLGDELDGIEGIRTVEIEAVTEAAELAIQNFETGDYQAMVDILGDDELAQQVVYSFETGEYVATADIDGNVDPAAAVMAAFLNGDHQTVADILGEDENARSVMRAFLSAYWSTTADIDGDDSSARGTMNSFIWQGWQTEVGVSANTGPAQAAINRLKGQTVSVNVVGNSVGGALGRAFNAAGGRADASAFGGLQASLPAFSTGGRLQSTGLGTDSILGISRSGTPTAWVDDREWIINQRASDKYDRTLAAINADHPSIRHLASYADGGRARSFAAPQPAPVMAPTGGGGPMTAEASLTGARVEIGPDGLGRFVDGRVRVSMRDPSVARATSQALARQGTRDRRAG